MPIQDPAWHRQWYLNNRDKRLAQMAERRNTARAIIIKAKSKPCADCGIQYPFYVMDLDHLDSTKKFLNVGQMRGYNLDKLRAEIAKCEAVCSNCHRVRTHQRSASVNG